MRDYLATTAEGRGFQGTLDECLRWLRGETWTTHHRVAHPDGTSVAVPEGAEMADIIISLGAARAAKEKIPS